MIARDSTIKGGSMIWLAVALAATGTPGGDGRWWMALREADRIWYIDSVSRREAGPIREFWWQEVYKRPRKRVLSVVRRSRIDCDAHRYLELSFTAYDVAGEIVTGTTQHGQLDDIVPDSLGESLALFACTGANNWPQLGGLPVERQPDRTTRDYFFLRSIGVADLPAAKMASFKFANHPDEISEMIDRWVPAAKQPRVRGLYGLKPKLMT